MTGIKTSFSTSLLSSGIIESLSQGRKYLRAYVDNITLLEADQQLSEKLFK